MENNLEVGKSHHEICAELNISQRTYFRHVKRIMNEDSKIWDKVHIDSAQYRAVRLIEALQNTSNLCKQIINDPNSRASDKIEAAKTLCISETHIFKIVQDGPVFKMSLPIFHNNNNRQELNDNNNNKQLPN
jgi:hypothetical protein